MAAENVLRILEKRRTDRAGIICILEDIQAECGYLSLDTLKLVAEKTGRSTVDLFGLAVFHQSLRLKPRGRHLVSVCTGTTCHVRGSHHLLEEVGRRLKTGPGEMTKDGLFTYETVHCLGACAHAPVMLADGDYHRKVTVDKVPKILNGVRRGRPESDLSADRRIFEISALCPHCNRSLMDDEVRISGHPSIRVTVSFGRQHGSMRLSGLYGDYKVECKLDIPDGVLLHFFCRRCHAQLRSTRICPRCDAPTILFNVKGGGVVVICSRHGCKEHLLDLGG